MKGQQGEKKKRNAPKATPLCEDIQKNFAMGIEWANNDSVSSEFARNFFLGVVDLQKQAEEGKISSRRYLDALARAMNFTPSSEKASRKKLLPSCEFQPELTELERLQLKEKEVRSLERYVSSYHKGLQKRIKILMLDIPVPEEKAKKETAALKEQLIGGSLSGGGRSQSEIPLPEDGKVKLMGKGTVVKKYIRKRRDLVLGRCDREFHLETRYNPQTGRSLYPDMSRVGPAGFQITWRAMANVVTLAFGVALPLSRIEKLFGRDGFSRSQTAQYCAYVAERLFPSYGAMIEELAGCDVLMGDDCNSRITELTRFRKDLAEWASERKKQGPDTTEWDELNPPPAAPWEGAAEGSLLKRLEKELDLPFVNFRADQTGQKVRLHTSVLSGEKVTGDSRTRVTVYRSQIGSLGNFADRVLLSRPAKQKELVFVADLSSANRIRNQVVTDRISITYAGCSSHARRPFWRHQDKAPEDFLAMLDFFRALYHIEEIIDTRAPHRRLEIRQDTVNGSLSVWADIRTVCESIQQKWSPTTEPGAAAGYILGNWDELTRYCYDERIPISNDLSERLLRYEKLMDRSSFGRETIEGRIRYDIIRSFYQTCFNAGVDPSHALIEVLITPKEKVEENPSHYTPVEIARRLQTDEKRSAEIREIMTSSTLAPLVEYREGKGNITLPEE